MSEPFQPPHRSWLQKFRDAGRGVVVALREQNSYLIHIVSAVGVIVAGAVFRIDQMEWCLVVLCIALVFTSELLNSALELLAKVASQRYEPLLRDALDISSGAVLAAGIGAAVVGVIVFGPYLWRLLA